MDYIWYEKYLGGHELYAENNVPTWAKSVSLNCSIREWFFNGGTVVNQLQGNFKIPGNYSDGSSVYFEVNWSPENNQSGDVKWQMEYSVWKKGATPNTPNIADVVVSTPLDKKNTYTEILLLNTALQADDLVVFRLFRDPLDGKDTYNYSAILHGVKMKCKAIN